MRSGHQTAPPLREHVELLLWGMRRNHSKIVYIGDSSVRKMLVHCKNILGRNESHYLHNDSNLGTRVSPTGQRSEAGTHPGQITSSVVSHHPSMMMAAVRWWLLHSGMAGKAWCLQLCAFLQRGFEALGWNGNIRHRWQLLSNTWRSATSRWVLIKIV